MRRRTVHLLALSLATFAALSVFASPASAAAPTEITLTGPGLTEQVTVRATDDPRLFKTLLSQVDWLATRPSNLANPDPTKLGPKFHLVVFLDGVADQAYDVYPLAIGGPKVFRPAEQPKKKGTAAWLHGRVSMPETLRAVGVPLVLPGPAQPGHPIDGPGGQGGGSGQANLGGVASPVPNTSLDDVLGEWQRGVLLVGGGALVLLALLGGVSRLVRRGPARDPARFR